MRSLILLALLSVSFVTHSADNALTIRAEGLVTNPGEHALPATARYADAALAAAPATNAYLTGSALLREALIPKQRGLKAGIVDSLSQVAEAASKREDDAVNDAILRLLSWLKALPVTGRKVALLDPRVVEITPAENLALANGDILHYPSRPNSVRIVGAVDSPCEVAFVPLQDARQYLSSCRAAKIADVETFYVIQPDGKTFKQGRAEWNRSEALALAPGAVLYVPPRVSTTEPFDADLDRDISAFLATQVLP